MITFLFSILMRKKGKISNNDFVCIQCTCNSHQFCVTLAWLVFEDFIMEKIMPFALEFSASMEVAIYNISTRIINKQLATSFL